MTLALSQAADVAPPMAGGVYSRPTTASAELIALPATTEGASKTRYWTFEAETKDVYLVFGLANTVVASATDASAIDGSGVLTADVNTTWHIPAGMEKSFRLPVTVTHLSHISLATGGYFRFYESTGTGE